MLTEFVLISFNEPAVCKTLKINFSGYLNSIIIEQQSFRNQKEHQNTSNTAGVVSDSHEEYLSRKTIDLRYVLEIHSQITDAKKCRLSSRNVLLFDNSAKL